MRKKEIKEVIECFVTKHWMATCRMLTKQLLNFWDEDNRRIERV